MIVDADAVGACGSRRGGTYRPLPRIRDVTSTLPAPAALECAQMRDRLRRRGLPPPLAALDIVRRYSTDRRRLDEERATSCLGAATVRGARHAFFAERATVGPRHPAGTAPEIERVGGVVRALGAASR